MHVCMSGCWDRLVELADLVLLSHLSQMKLHTEQVTDLPEEIDVNSYNKFCSLQLEIDFTLDALLCLVEQDAC